MPRQRRPDIVQAAEVRALRLALRYLTLVVRATVLAPEFCPRGPDAEALLDAAAADLALLATGSEAVAAALGILDVYDRGLRYDRPGFILAKLRRLAAVVVHLGREA